jgi:GrpB-like predicted nucleotidyltransferase (UPF0157 family)
MQGDDRRAAAERDLARAGIRDGREYVALKRALAARYPEDREVYTEGKAPFIRRVEGESQR